MQRETNHIIVNKSKIYPNRISLVGSTVSENGKRYHAECNEVTFKFDINKSGHNLSPPTGVPSVGGNLARLKR